MNLLLLLPEDWREEGVAEIGGRRYLYFEADLGASHLRFFVSETATPELFAAPPAIGDEISAETFLLWDGGEPIFFITERK